jgi:hypothetical protein
VGKKEAFLSTICLIVAVVSTYFFARLHHREQPRIFVHQGKYAHSEWIKDFRAACPHMAFVKSEEAADYIIEAFWAAPRGRWFTWTERRDTALIHRADGPDYVQLLRESCRLIQDDLKDWRLPDGSLPDDKRPGLASTKANADRYELHDVRNGTVVSSAIFDRQTGRVWVWTNMKGKNGAESAFIAEDVYSYIESPKPDPDAEIPQR